MPVALPPLRLPSMRPLPPATQPRPAPAPCRPPRAPTPHHNAPPDPRGAAALRLAGPAVLRLWPHHRRRAAAGIRRRGRPGCARAPPRRGGGGGRGVRPVLPGRAAPRRARQPATEAERRLPPPPSSHRCRFPRRSPPACFSLGRRRRPRHGRLAAPVGCPSLATHMSCRLPNRSLHAAGADDRDMVEWLRDTVAEAVRTADQHDSLKRVIRDMRLALEQRYGLAGIQVGAAGWRGAARLFGSTARAPARALASATSRAPRWPRPSPPAPGGRRVCHLHRRAAAADRRAQVAGGLAGQPRARGRRAVRGPVHPVRGRCPVGGGGGGAGRAVGRGRARCEGPSIR